MASFGNTFDSGSFSVGHARKVWREIVSQYPAGGKVLKTGSDWSSWVSAGKIPAGTPCKWYNDAANNNGKMVQCFVKSQICDSTEGFDVNTLGINGFTLNDIIIKDTNTVATATVVYAGELYDYMIDSDVLAALKNVKALTQIKFVS